ncbi:MAG: SPFH domain-containing protein [Candidatus Methylumidiphilus sp.]
MFGIKFIKFQPNVHVLKYQKGEIVHEGLGLSFFYYTPTTSLVAVPISSLESPFIFAESTKDFQAITIQGQVTFRIVDVKKTSVLLNYTLNNSGKAYISDDPEKLSQRIIDIVHVLIKKEVSTLPLKLALTSTEELTLKINNAVVTQREIVLLGIEVLGVAILAILPTKETARALEAETREQILKEADDAIYIRRNAAIEQERIIKENELNTEIAVERKRRQIRETQMEAEQAVQEKRHELEADQMSFNIKLEDQRQALVRLAVDNAKAEAEAKAYAVGKLMDAFRDVNPGILQSLASVGMAPETLIALAFQGLAEKADKIGELNISPDLLRELLKKPSANVTVSPSPGSAGVSPAGMAAKMAAFPGKAGGSEHLPAS